jgi:probable HAF family extracellular repeat protein
MRKHIHSAARAATLFLTLTCSAAMGQVSFRGLGTPNLYIYDMSADGNIAVGLAYTSSGESPGIRWTAGGTAEVIGGSMGNIAISRDGKTIVGATRTGLAELQNAAIWQGGTNWKSLANLPGAIPDSVNGVLSQAASVSADGSVIAGRAYDANRQVHAVRWDASGAIKDLGSLGGGDTVASTVSANGKLIGGYDFLSDPNGTPNGRRGVVWVDGSERFIHLYGWAGEVRATNDVGSVIVGDAHPMSGVYVDVGGGLTSYLYTAWDGHLTNLGGIWKRGPGERGEDYSSKPSNVSDDGQVVGGQAFIAGPRKAFIWTPETGMLTVSDYLTRNGITAHNDWITLEFVTYISPNGKTFIGSGINPSGLIETYIITRP